MINPIRVVGHVDFDVGGGVEGSVVAVAPAVHLCGRWENQRSAGQSHCGEKASFHGDVWGKFFARIKGKMSGGGKDKVEDRSILRESR